MQFSRQLVSAAFAGTAVLAGFPTAALADDDESLWQQTKNRVSAIANQGNNELYLSGYAYHGRGTYSREKIDQFNEESWGGGFGRTLRNASGNDESLFFMGISDSHKQPQFMGGYGYEWIWPIGRTGVETGLGYSAMLMSRQDYFSGVPFPIVLPVASIGIKGAKFMASYVPRLTSNGGNGDVLYMFLRFQLPNF